MSKKRKKSKKKAKINNVGGLWNVSEKRVLIGTGLFFLMVAVISFIIPFLVDSAGEYSFKSYENREVPHSRVCFVGNDIKFKKLNKLTIDNKTYWICCNRCKAEIMNNSNIRYAVDPLSNHRVNKSDAIIMQNPASENKVIYFESKLNFNKYYDGLQDL